MERHPRFDEADAADQRADLVADLVAERFGSLTSLTLERDRTPPPHPNRRNRNPAADDTPADYARRCADLNDALDPHAYPADDYRRAA